MDARAGTSVLAALTALALLAAAPAGAGHVAVLVTPAFDPADFDGRGAVGLLVPGVGPTTSGREALDLLGLKDLPAPGCAKRRPCPVEILVALPSGDDRPNDRRYPIAIAGGGYRGLLTSTSTRVPGLVAISDVAPTVRALERGEHPPIRWQAEPDAVERLEQLDRRIDGAHRTRVPGELVLAGLVLAGSLLALALGSPFTARFAGLAAAATLLAALVLSAAGITNPWLVTLLLVVLAAAGGLAAAARPGLFPLAFLATLVASLVVLAAWPEVGSLAVIGPHLENGGRFYGLTNLTSTLLLAFSLAATAELGLRWVVPVGALTVIAVGWSRAGADGGGLVVVLVGFAVLALRLSGRRPGPRLLVAGAAGAVLLALLLVGIDAATGGESHVTRAVGDGPGPLLDDWGDRLGASADRFTASWYAPLVVCVSLAALVVLPALGPRFPAGDALLAALAVSLLVNDHPSHVAAAGALSYGVLWTHERVRRAAPLAR